MRPEEWIVSNDTGTSSKLIWCVMMGVEPKGDHDFYVGTPSDPSDFGRCYRLFQKFPHWKARFSEVATKYPKWKPMVENWDKMERLYARDFQTGKSTELYGLMNKLNGRG